MEYFHGGGGRSNPDFCYRFTVENVTNDMWQWLEAYPYYGPFERWYIQHNYKELKYEGGTKNIPLIQIESRKAAYMFRLTFSEYILKDETYSFARGLDEPFN